MAYKRYDDELRANCVLMLEAAGWPDKLGASTKVARATGVNRRTLERWARRQFAPPPQKLIKAQRQPMADILEDLLYKMAGHMDDAVQDAPLHHLATAYGIAFDKLRLLRGESTDNNALKIQVVYDPDTTPYLTATTPRPNGRHNGRD